MIRLPLRPENDYLFLMDIVFKCPHCGTDLEVEAEAAGQQIDCPSCDKALSIPASSAVRPSAPPLQPPTLDAKADKKMAVPYSSKPVEPLIQKAGKSLEVVAKESKHGLRVRTIRHSDCKEVGKDLFDDKVSEVLSELGDGNIQSITPINYSYVDMGTQKLLTDFGVMIVYRV